MSYYKMLLCRDHFIDRRCPRGRTCTFAHGVADLKGPAAEVVSLVVLPPKFSMGITHIDALHKAEVTSMRTLVDAAARSSNHVRTGIIATPPGIVSVALTDLYSFCKENLRGLILRLEDATASDGPLVAKGGPLDGGDRDRVGYKWVGYYENPADRCKAREYIEADKETWLRLTSLNADTLEGIMQSVLVSSNPPPVGIDVPAGTIVVKMHWLKNWCRSQARGGAACWINIDALVANGLLVTGGEFPDEWVAYADPASRGSIRPQQHAPAGADIGFLAADDPPPATAAAMAPIAPPSPGPRVARFAYSAAARPLPLATAPGRSAKSCQLWTELTEVEQAAARKLGWESESWEAGATTHACQQRWNALPPELQAAAFRLGYTESDWDSEQAVPEVACCGHPASPGSTAVLPPSLPPPLPPPRPLAEAQLPRTATAAVAATAGLPEGTRAAVEHLISAVCIDVDAESRRTVELERELHASQLEIARLCEQHEVDKHMIARLRGDPEEISKMTIPELESLLKDVSVSVSRILNMQAEARERHELCVVCMAKPRTVLFDPCRHLVCCGECAEKVKFCPSCKQDIALRLGTRQI